MVFKHCLRVISQKFLLLFYIFSSTLNIFVWSLCADYLLLLNTSFCFTFWGFVEFIRLSLEKNPSPLSVSSLRFSFNFLRSFSIFYGSQLPCDISHTLFISYSPLPSSFSISLWSPVTLPSHPPFFLLPAGMWLFLSLVLLWNGSHHISWK